MTNPRNTVFYVGVTNDIEKRVNQHKMRSDIDSFTAHYNLSKLVYLEETNNVNAAIAREKQIKGWVRKRKKDLIESVNPEWKDLMPS